MKGKIKKLSQDQINLIIDRFGGEFCGTGDEEFDHRLADDAMCGIMRELGLDFIVDLFNDLGKWYA